MKISELARRTGVSAHALRHYERLGLIAPERRPNGYRDYPEAMRREVVFIAMSRRIGFSLASIAQRLPAYRAGRLGFEEMEEAMRERIAEIDREIGGLAAQRQQVVEHIAWLREQKAKARARREAGPAAKPWPRVRGRRNSKESP